MQHELDGQITINITDAAQIVGVTATTIRNWERAGLINPQRTEKRYRIFTVNDIERLRKIKALSIDKNMNLSSIASLLGKDYTYQNATSSVTRTMLGEKWQKHRIKKGLSINEVAEKIGISASYLAKIESAQANVSFDILKKLAEFYGENPLYYFQSDTNDIAFHKKDQHESFEIGLEGVSVSSRSSLKDARISPMIYTVQPLCGRLKANSHHGEEFLYVTSGRIEFCLKDECYLLYQGDTIHYSSSVPHKWRNPSETEIATMLWVYTVGGEM